jgi:hypothetical protein
MRFEYPGDHAVIKERWRKILTWAGRGKRGIFGVFYGMSVGNIPEVLIIRIKVGERGNRVENPS